MCYRYNSRIYFIKSYSMKKVLMLLCVCFLPALVRAQTGTCHCGTGGGFSFSASPGEAVAFVPGSSRWVADMRYMFLALQPELTTADDTLVQPESMQLLLPGLGFRLSDKIGFAAALPFYNIRTGTSGGIHAGDLQLAAHYTMRPHFTWPAMLRFVAGVKLPTGSTAVIADRSIVVGTGSVDFTGGMQFQVQRKKMVYRYAGQFRYAGTGYENIRFGNSTVQQTGITFTPKAAACAADSTTRKLTTAYTADVTGEWQQMQSQGVSYFENSGQQNVWLGAGVVFRYGALTVPVAVEVPVYHDHHGHQATPQFRLRAGLSVKIH